MKKSIKEKGITLVALVITIIILLILAGVTIGVATNGTGLFEKAKLATDEYNNKAKQEETQIAKYTNEIDSYVDGNRGIITLTEEQLKQKIQETLATQDITSSFRMDSTCIEPRGNVQMTKSGNTIVLIGYFNVKKALSVGSVIATIDEAYRPNKDYSVIGMYNNNSVLNLNLNTNGTITSGQNITNCVLTINMTWHIF